MNGIRNWEKAVVIKPQDNLCASTFTQKAFIPSYEKWYCKPNMTLMMSMEYRRMWFEERAAWQVDAYPKRKKDSTASTYEQRWREKIKKKESSTESAKPKRKKSRKYQSCRSKTDSGQGYVGCLPKGTSPCQAKATPEKTLSAGNSPTRGSLEGPEKATAAAERQPTESVTNQPAVQSSLTSEGDGALPIQSTQVPVQQSQGHELVPKCPKCRAFHAQRARCPPTVLCKDNAFRDRILNDTC